MRGGRNGLNTEAAEEIHPGKNSSIKHTGTVALCSGYAWAAFLLSEEPSN